MKRILFIIVIISLSFFCSCGKHSNNTREQLKTNNIETVYWTDGDMKCHISSDCSALDKTYELYSRTYTAAEEAGKNELCTICRLKMLIQSLAKDKTSTQAESQ